MRNPVFSKWVVYMAGSLLFAASLVFIGAYAARHWAEVTAVHLAAPASLAASIAFYAISHVSTALSWPLALRRMRESIPLPTGVRIGLVSQVGKYLPGNVAHYIGRSGLAANAGIPIRTSTISVAVELTSALAAGMLVASLMLLLDPEPVAFLPKFGSAGVIAGLAIATAVIATFIWSARQGYGATLLVAPSACLAISFILSGLSFHALSAALGHANLSIPAAIGAFALAWVAGFVLPGAPAGLGVREAILVSLIAPLVGPGAALTCVLLHRLITALVDGAAALIGYCWIAYASLAKT